MTFASHRTALAQQGALNDQAAAAGVCGELQRSVLPQILHIYCGKNSQTFPSDLFLPRIADIFRGKYGQTRNIY